jgi:hypothetical protein
VLCLVASHLFVFIPSFYIVGHESPAVVESVISPVILNVWASHVLDPFISIDALEVLEVMVLMLILLLILLSA